MDLNRLYILFEDPTASNALEDFDYVMDLTKRYPFSQPLQMLALKLVGALKPIDLKDELSNRVVYVNDRSNLYNMLNLQHLSWAKKKNERADVDNNENSRQFELINEFLSQADQDPFPEQLDDLLPKVDEVLTVDYAQSLLTQPDLSDRIDDISDDTSETDTVIEKFIDLDSKRPEAILMTDSTRDNVVDQNMKSEGHSESLIQHEAFLTESLAKIYIKQKKYAKALEIIKKLSLKYPEKNVYFADQIRYLEKIIINIKTE